MHPLGFAYYPDGAHADADELEPGIVPPGSSSTCDTTKTCPSPMYFNNDAYLGKYSNNNDLDLSGHYSNDFDSNDFSFVWWNGTVADDANKTGNSTATGKITKYEDDFGLDNYEPMFFHPLTEWIGYGNFTVYLKFDADTDYKRDIFVSLV